MNLFGMYFSPAEAILLIALFLVVLLCFSILRKLSSVKTVEMEAAQPAAEISPVVNLKAGEEELVAVLTAAAAMMMGEDAGNIKISSIKRVRRMPGGSSAWARAGRMEQLVNNDLF